MSYKISEISFDAIIAKKNRYEGCSYDFMRMACYPLTKSEGNETYSVTLHISINGKIHDAVIQQQNRVSKDSSIDLELVKYYFLLRNFDVEDGIEEIKEEHEDAEIVTVKIEAYRKDLS